MHTIKTGIILLQFNNETFIIFNLKRVYGKVMFCLKSKKCSKYQFWFNNLNGKLLFTIFVYYFYNLVLSCSAFITLLNLIYLYIFSLIIAMRLD